MSAGKTSLVATLVGGRYLVDQEIGAGGISTVYLARDFQAFGRNVVVKVLQDTFQQDEYIVKKFRQEAEALSRVDHPNVVSIHGRGELEDGRPYIVLQYIKGQSLRDIIVPGGINLERAATIIRWVAHALTATHEAGVLHRDLKPENVMLQTFGEEERVVVIDFGIAQVKDSVIGHKTSLATAVGTVSYMSPEQLSGDPLTPASDTFALGVIAYELITGEKPFKPSTAYQLLDEQRAGVAVPPKQLRPELHGPAQEAILRALSFDPAGRQTRTRDFGNDVYRFVTGSTAPLSGPLPEPPARPVPRTRMMEVDGIPSAEDYEPEPPAPDDDRVVSAAPANPLNEARPNEARREDSSYVAAAAAPPPVTPPPPQRPHKLLFVAVGLVLLFSLVAAAVVGFFVWKKMSEASVVVEPTVTATPTPRATATPAATPTPQAPATPPLSLEYSLTIQPMRDGKRYRAPFESTGRERYENGTLFHINILSPDPGYLYLINEGPTAKGEITYRRLYPASEDARLSGGQKARIPDGDDFVFEGKGENASEKFWIIWSGKPVPEMEALKQSVEPYNDITDPAQIETVRAFLSRHQTAKTEAVEESNKMTIKSSDDVLIYRSELKRY
ncbi:MAG TPA: protein kinase [Pyrinomonadaceae bacterium]